MAPECLALSPVSSPDMRSQTAYTASVDTSSSMGCAAAVFTEESPESAEQPRLGAAIITGIMLPRCAARSAPLLPSLAPRFASTHCRRC